jgi:hypothetical protein
MSSLLTKPFIRTEDLAVKWYGRTTTVQNYSLQGCENLKFGSPYGHQLLGGSCCSSIQGLEVETAGYYEILVPLTKVQGTTSPEGPKF